MTAPPNAPGPEDRAPGEPAETGPASFLAFRYPSLRYVLKGFDLRVTVIMSTAAVLLLLFRKFGGSGTFEHALRPEALRKHPYLSVYGDYYWFLACFVLLGFLPWLLTRPRALRPASLGLGLGDWRFGLKWLAILYGAMLPIVAIAALTTTFSRYYPLNDTVANHASQLLAGEPTPEGFLATFLLYELLYGVYFVGWEFFFRGYLTFGLHERLGINGVLIGNIPFVLMHVGKPFPEALGSLFGGLALGLFALRTRSFWYCWLLHALVAWTMDACALLARTWG